MRTAATPQVEVAPATLWRCGGRDCGAGECEHDENKLHRHASGPGPDYAPGIVHEVLRTSGAPLPTGVRGTMEQHLGHDFADVRIHTDAAAGRSATAVNALAYTVGRHVVFGAGHYDPVSASGQRLLRHELSHAADAGPGAAPPAGSLRVSSPQDAKEQRAHRMADARSAPPAGTGAHAAEPVLQRQVAPPAPAPSTAPSPAPAPAPSPPAAPAAAAAPATCVPSHRLNWADFSGTPATGGTFHALTSFSFSSTNAAGRDWIVATFNGGSSWVRPRAANPGTRTLNGCQPQVAGCEQFFDDLPAGNTGWQSLGRGTGCAASPQPDTTLRATARGECDSVLGVECDRVAALESARLLAHEQLHFDLACALAATGNAALAPTAPSAASILAAVNTKAGTQTTAYDTSSQHGCHAANQSTWATQIGLGLPAVTIP